MFEKLEHNSKLVIAWFETNYMQLNTDKYHLLNTSCEDYPMWAKIGKDVVWKSNIVKLLRITKDNHLKFDNY